MFIKVDFLLLVFCRDCLYCFFVSMWGICYTIQVCSVLAADFVGFLSVPVVVTEPAVSPCLDQVVNCVDFSKKLNHFYFALHEQNCRTHFVFSLSLCSCWSCGNTTKLTLGSAGVLCWSVLWAIFCGSYILDGVFFSSFLNIKMSMLS